MKKILAIDDNSINLELISQIVKVYYPDFKFMGALSGQDGISIAQKENPDLILLDIMMPDLDGYETCKLLKKHNRTKQIPIIMVSALGRDSVERTKGLNAGADSFISKPFDQIELKAQINVALRIKSYQLQLKKLNSEITLVEERERRRIADNLHDSLGQTLGLAFMNLSAIDIELCSPDIKNTLKFTSKLLNKAIEESRRLTYDLSPPILYELGLLPAIQWKLEQFEKDSNITTKLIAEKKNTKLSKENNIFLYRTVGELLTNISKHAEATEVAVRQSTNNGMYCISVEDNGVGIDKSQMKPISNKGGFGLLSIEERIESLNGTFNIEALPKGTKAEIEIPYSLDHN
ncbi:ATP-binding response regulator [Draconibacterium halophilum]|uniref:Oxygen sensor histidine kinase NreB n=1 Tax=Draconibacterium halophilum TaxID=2706887 RepID=A0A6C0RAH1_9BACT|nr:response regulator [Draconibacterium halophilum]QIA07394.1 response regulator [Draconibacterium halophilum]